MVDSFDPSDVSMWVVAGKWVVTCDVGEVCVTATHCLISIVRNVFLNFVLTARCYASVVTAMGLCLSVRHKSVFYRNG